MTQPKAKWSLCPAGDVWRAEVGPFRLEVIPTDGECLIQDADTYAQIWFQKVPTPCDAPDLMRLTEAELARRLEHAAGTMDGKGLVAERSRRSEQEPPSLAFYGKQPFDACSPPPAAESPRWLKPRPDFGTMAIGLPVVRVSSGWHGEVVAVDAAERQSRIRFNATRADLWVKWSDLAPAGTSRIVSGANLRAPSSPQIDVSDVSSAKPGIPVVRDDSPFAGYGLVSIDPRASQGEVFREVASPSVSSEPRFKIGDIVRSKYSRALGEVLRVGDLTCDVSFRGSSLMAYGHHELETTGWGVGREGDEIFYRRADDHGFDGQPLDLEGGEEFKPYPLPSATPRFKVGDLVRSTRRNRVGVCSGVSGPNMMFVSFVDNESELIHAADLQPYTLPTITSYAELADVLDELPEGWRVERAIADGRVRVYQRARIGYSARGEVKTGWVREAAVGMDYDQSEHRMLPPESAK